MIQLGIQNIVLVGAALVVAWVASLLYHGFWGSLRNVPGPLLAKFSPFWRVWFVRKGDAHVRYRSLHEKYGSIVRTAPSVVDISDPAVIPTIYGIGSKFLKVCALCSHRSSHILAMHVVNRFNRRHVFAVSVLSHALCNIRG